MTELFPEHCSCGCPIDRAYDLATHYAWAHYECGTDRAGKGCKPLDRNIRTDRTDLCRYIADLRKRAGLTSKQAYKKVAAKHFSQ